MPVLSSPKIERLSQAADPKQAIIKAVGNISGLKVGSDLVLLGTYIRNEMTAGGIIRPKENVEEDEYQGKVGLVLKAGPMAAGGWEDEATSGQMAELHTWVVYQIKDAWPVQINGTPCRFVPYEKIRAQIPEPSMVL